MSGNIRHNEALHRYELEVDGGLVFADYRPQGDKLLIVHTETPPALQGRGLAGQLVKGMLADIRARGLKIVPQCSYIVAYLQRHPEERDLVAQ
ncbi:GNAT family N-acetyltransferase [Sphingobium nicotianae]|uniref:N-acetyltransferase n=1 Tax=Sphingobium nicotianae TaxID=2782607 RepID=A0A9X1DDD0_9SPHN|nr:GNAT family N-acetyltransferase [Sphingobium nicotianae]MBT2187958.1 N-acetyltransferase [Sphingobium nicotianae]